MSRPSYPYNCHMHTCYDDGESSAEEMVRAAIDAGMVCAGFSGHSVLPFENDWSMTPESEIAYRQEIARLKEKYADRLHISCGLEWDLDSPLPEEPYDFYIGSAHHIHAGGKIYSVDASAGEQRICVREAFGGDSLRYAREYFACAVRAAVRPAVSIVGHFDLLTKFNGEGIIDEMNPAYVKAACEAVEEILAKKPDIFFEVNTGAMYRLGKKEPYPSTALLSYLHEKGACLVLNSDAHRADALLYGFGEMLALLTRIGFKELYYLQGKEFKVKKICG